MSKIIKIITILLMCLGIQMSGVTLLLGTLEDDVFACIGAIGSFILLTSLSVVKAVEVEDD